MNRMAAAIRSILQEISCRQGAIMITTDVRRITVAGPRRRSDVAVPCHISIGDFFPVAVRLCQLSGPELADAPGGWVLQRLGSEPFALSDTIASAGLRDGETIYLRPRVSELPPATSDDVADSIASVHSGPGRWSVADARRVCLGAGAAGLAAGAVLLATSSVMSVSGHAGLVRLGVASAVTVLLVLASAAMARGFADAMAGATLGYAALPYAFVAGAGIVARSGSMVRVGAPAVLAGLAVVCCVAVVCGVAAGAASQLCGPALASGIGLLGAWLDVAAGRVGPAGAAALTACVALALTPLMPGIALRMARVPLPPVPASADDLRAVGAAGDADPDDRRVAAADRLLAGFASGTGLACGAAALVLGVSALHSGGRLTGAVLATLGLALLLRSRAFRSRTARLSLMIPGYLATGLAIASIGGVPAVAALVAGCGLLTWAGVWLPGHRPSPVWGRAADILDITSVVALFPLALGVAGVFGYVRGLGG
jgi:type VII secretion integral membrane protein EccD